MKRWLILIALLMSSLAWAGSTTVVVGQGGAGGGGACTDACPANYIRCQNAEGTGYDNSEGWTEATGGGTVDEDSTTSPLRGSQSIRFSGSSSPQTLRNTTAISAGADYFAHFMVRFADATPASDSDFFTLNESGTDRGRLQLTSTGYLKILQGSSATGTTTQLQDNTTYHIWVEFHPETGEGNNDGIMRVYIGTSITKPGSPEATLTNGTAVQQPTYYYFRTPGAGATWDIDQIIFDDEEIGSVCE